jgi:hypothetical protein
MQHAVISMPTSASSGFAGFSAGAQQLCELRSQIQAACARSRQLRAEACSLRQRMRLLRTTVHEATAAQVAHRRDLLRLRAILLARLQRARALIVARWRVRPAPLRTRIRAIPFLQIQLDTPSATIRSWPPLAVIPPDHITKAA